MNTTHQLSYGNTVHQYDSKSQATIASDKRKQQASERLLRAPVSHPEKEQKLISHNLPVASFD
jgi:hypothetical protein